MKSAILSILLLFPVLSFSMGTPTRTLVVDGMMPAGELSVQLNAIVTAQNKACVTTCEGTALFCKGQKTRATTQYLSRMVSTTKREDGRNTFSAVLTYEVGECDFQLTDIALSGTAKDPQYFIAIGFYDLPGKPMSAHEFSFDLADGFYGYDNYATDALYFDLKNLDRLTVNVTCAQLDSNNKCIFEHPIQR